MTTEPEKIIVPDVRHSRLGPSGADRWMNCHGSNNIIDAIVRQLGYYPPSSKEAREGTAGHAVLARCLFTGEEAWMQAGKVVVVETDEFVVDAEMVEAVDLTIQEVMRLKAEYPNGVLYVERELSSVLDPDAFGQGDIIYEVPGVAIFVLDFKYGAGKVVEPTHPQLRQYGYYAYEGRGQHMRGDTNEPQKIICGVAQPRIPHPKGLIRWATYDVVEVEEWFATDVLSSMAETRKPDALLCVGDWCGFCPAKQMNKCPALLGEAMSVNTDIQPKTLTLDEISKMLKKLPLLEKVIKRVQEEAFARAMAGESIPDFKLVDKKTNRVYRESIVQEMEGQQVTVKLEEAAVALFGLEAYEPTTLKSPATLEEMPQGKDFVARWAYKPNNGLTLAPMSDSRSARQPLMNRMDEPLKQDNSLPAAANAIPI